VFGSPTALDGGTARPAAHPPAVAPTSAVAIAQVQPRIPCIIPFLFWRSSPPAPRFAARAAAA
jgi:hypothetical protein